MKKRAFTTAVMMFAMIGCGGANATQESELKTSPRQTLDQRYDQIISVTGSLTKVGHLHGLGHEDGPGRTLTVATLEIPAGCFDSFATLSHKAVYSDSGKVDLYVAAYNYHDNDSKAAFCTQEFRGAKRTIQLDGIFTKQDIDLHWLDGRSTSIKEGDLSVGSLDTLRVTEAKMICPSGPEGVHCLAIGSTVTLQATLNGCRDRLGNVAHTAIRGEDGKVSLFVSALNVANVASRKVRCAAMPTEKTQLSIPHNVRGPQDLNLETLR